MEQSELLHQITTILLALEKTSWQTKSMLKAARQRIITALEKKNDLQYSRIVYEIIEVLAKAQDKRASSDIALFSLKVSGDFEQVVKTTHRYLSIAVSIPGAVSDTGVFHRGFVKNHGMEPDKETGIFLHMNEHVYASELIRREELSHRTYYSEANLFPPLVEQYYDHVDDLISYVKDRNLDLKEGFDHEGFKAYLSTASPSLRRGTL